MADPPPRDVYDQTADAEHQKRANVATGVERIGITRIRRRYML
jgi:hypothetical protein